MRFSSFAAPAALALLAVATPIQAQYSSSAPAVTEDIVQVAAAAGTFTTLLAAAEAAGLVDVLKSEGPFTVFAPTDEAFAALPEGTIESLLANPEALRAILLYHVVPGKVMAAQVVGLEEAATAQGAMIAISTYGDTVRINDATVVAADIEASNGVIHVIDTVILPPSAN
jgi:transforming growth factor-beta-induced protein